MTSNSLPGYAPPKPVVRAVPHLNVCLLQLVQIQIEDGDFHHVGVVVVAGERLLFEEPPLRRLEQRAVDMAALEVRRFGVLAQNVGEGGDEEAGRAARRIADALSRLRVQRARRSDR